MKHKILTRLEEFDSLDFIPTLIVGFYQVGTEENFLKHYKTFKDAFPHADIIGCSSESNIYNSIPYVDIDGSHICTYMCIEMKKEHYTLQLLKEVEALSFDKEKEYAAIILSASYNHGLENTVDMLQEKIGKNSLFGAIAGTEFSSVNSGSIFYNGDYISEGTLVWLIDQAHYLLKGIAVHDFDPVGFDLEITGARDTTILEIEGKPALGMIEEMIGTLDAERIASFDHPFFIRRKENSKAGDRPLSSLSHVNREENSITIYKEVYVGDKLKLAVPLNREHQEKQLDKFTEYHTENGIGFLFVCMAHKGHWGEMEPIYLMHIAKKIEIPFMGIHSLGEVGPLNVEDFSLIQNQTITLAVLSEKEGEHETI